MLTPDTRIHERYRIVRHIAGGGMGHIYEAVDDRFNSTVALKHLTISGESAEKAFAQEARLLNHLRHPALPRVTDYFSEDMGQFLVMDFIPGKDLNDMLTVRGQPFPVNDVMAWVDQLLDTLAYIHAQDVVHRDIKPQNLKLLPDGRIFLLDFGIAKNLTGSRSIQAFTPQFAPLEQIQGDGTDPRSDLYSLAATAYCLLTGKQPQSSITRFTEMMRQRIDVLVPLHQVNPSVPLSMSTVLMQALSLHADDRFANAAVMQQALRQAPQIGPKTVVDAMPAHIHTMTTLDKAPPLDLPVPVPASPPPPARRGRAWLLPVIVVFLLLCFLVGAGGAFVVSRGNALALFPRDPTIAPASSLTPLGASSSEATAVTQPISPEDDAGLVQAAALLNVTQTAIAALELTMVAQSEQSSQADVELALRQTEQAVNATVQAISATQTAQAARVDRPPSPAAVADGNVCDRATVIGSITELAIQESPEIDNAVLRGTVPVGRSVDVLCRDPIEADGRVWVWIRFESIEGWMSTRYLRFDQGIPVGICTTATVTGPITALSIREETNRNSRYLGEVPVNQQVSVLCVPPIDDDERTWVMVRSGTIEGWMSMLYLRIE